MHRIVAILTVLAAWTSGLANTTFVVEAGQLTGPVDLAATGYHEISLDNRDAADFSYTVLRLADGRTLGDYEEAFDAVTAAFQSGADPTGPLAAFFAIGTTVGGTSAVPAGAVIRIGLDLESGNYLLDGNCAACPPGQSQRHLLTVVDGPRGESPKSDVAMSMSDFHFGGVASELPSGPLLWRIANDGAAPHVMVVYQLADGATLDDLIAYMRSGQRGPPPAEIGVFVASTAYLSPGAHYFETLDLAPGSYLIVCPIPDAASGSSHLELGMVQVLTVR